MAIQAMLTNIANNVGKMPWIGSLGTELALLMVSHQFYLPKHLVQRKPPVTSLVLGLSFLVDVPRTAISSNSTNSFHDPPSGGEPFRLFSWSGNMEGGENT
jgi:hypothetical protein